MEFDRLISDMRACAACSGLPLGPRPIFQLDMRAPILIAGQAPGRLTHAKGVPFDDPSGERLRAWLGVTRAEFYDPARFAILPMGLCFPGSGKGGDLPPRPNCAPLWRERVLQHLPNLRLTITLGRHARDWHLPSERGKGLGDTVAAWRNWQPSLLPLPHPSPRNISWFANNPLFETQILPALRRRVRELDCSAETV